MNNRGFTSSHARPLPKQPPEAAPAKPNGGADINVPEIVPFDTFDAGDWEGIEIEPRRWLVLNRIPLAEPGIVSGDGGTGKTKLKLQLSIAVAAELPDWIGGVVETHGPAIVYSAEEKLKEMHRRCADILAHRGLSFDSLKGRLKFICDPDEVILGKTDRDGIVRPTMSLLRLEKTITLIRPAFVVIENAADVYAGDENNRSTVTRFVRKLLGGLTEPSDATVALIQHPSVSGINDGSGRSGSTGWNNAGRWRLNLTKEDRDAGIRQLEVMKANYGPEGEKVQVRWERGVFVPVGTGNPFERAAATASVDDTFMRCLDAAAAQGRNISPNKGITYAPAVFEGMAEAADLKGKPTIKRKALTEAMERLMAAGKIKGETFGPPSKLRTRLVRADDNKPR
jgi:RecA-family ATPase